MSKYDEIIEVEKANPYHDSLGRFTTGGGGGGAASGGRLSDKVKSCEGTTTNDMLSAWDRINQAAGGTLDTDRTIKTKPGTYKIPSKKKHGPTVIASISENHNTGKCTINSVIVGKSADYDHIEEVEKFNPFHDSRGRFSNKNGFASYSANPNTRAGAMAIARSAAAGHGNTANVHRESYGENIRQNANWIGRGKQQTPHQQGTGTLRYRVEPIGGLQGASAAGASWQHQNQAQGRTTKPGKQQNQQQQQNQQAQQKPAAPKQTQPQPQKPQTLASEVSDVTLHTGDKLAIVPRNAQGHNTTTRKLVNDHDQPRVEGKDISKTADIRTVKGSKEPIDKIAELQGWNKSPTVTNDLETFQKAAKKSGTLLFRSVDGNYHTGQSADDVCKDTMTNGNGALGGNGGKLYSSGMYCVGAQTNNATGRNLAHQINGSQNHSYAYADTQMMATVHHNAKIATPTQAGKLKSEYLNLSTSDRNRFGDVGSYIASKGYDGARWHDRSDPYITMYNKSAMIFYGGVASR